MAETCIENPDYLVVNGIPSSKYKHEIELQNCFEPQHENSALLILNQEIKMPKLFMKLWNRYMIKVCADGAANKLYQFCVNNNVNHNDYLPDYIVGDLDSIDENIAQFYKEKGVYVIKQTTQYSTDFKKSINLITCHFYATNFKDHLQSSNEDSNYGISLEKGIHDIYATIKNVAELPKLNVLALGGIDGRFDQTIHSITQLYTLTNTDPYIRMFFLTENDLIFIIPPDGVLLRYDAEFRKACIGNCGLLPVGLPTEIIETIGLKWDVANWPTSIESGRVSSSNRFSGHDKCYINVKDGMIINVEIKKDVVANYV